jgi:predicted amidohydrolase
MEKKQFKLAMGQMLVAMGLTEQNLRRAENMIQDAAGRGCSVIVLPECLDIGWTNPRARELAKPVPGEISDRLSNAARKAGIYVVAGLTEADGDKVYNTAVLISPDGRILLKHRKLNVLSIAQDIYDTGDRLGVVETDIGRVAVNICSDNFPKSLVFGHSLARMGAQLLLSPSAWAVRAGHDNEKDPCDAIWLESYSELARLYDMTVVGVSNVGPITDGPWQGREAIGNSLAVGPGGKILGRGPYGVGGEALIVVPVEITPCKVTGTNIAEMLKDKGYEGR